METLIIETKALGARATASMSSELDVEELGTWLGRAFGAVARHLERTGNPPVGPPFARYHPLSEHRFQVEAGFPVADEIDPVDGIVNSHLPGGDVAFTTHYGPYKDLGATYAALHQWLESRGATAVGDAWEVYFNEPDDPPSAWRTDVYQPFRRLEGAA